MTSRKVQRPPDGTLIVALLSYYREPDSFLKQLVKSLPRAGVEKLIALDGAYARFPGGTAHSPLSNRRVLEKACESAGVDLWHVAPDEVWAGDEIEKRTVLFALAETVTTENDWYFVVDGDEQVTQAPGDLHEILSSTDLLVGECDLWSKSDSQPLRMFFKAIRGLRPVGTHFTYGLPDGRVLWGGYGQETEEALSLPVRVQHKTLERSAARRNASLGYYDQRDKDLVESGPCAFCGTETAHMIPYDWRPQGRGITAQRALCCTTCLKPRLRESADQAIALGVNPADQLPELVV